MTTNDTPLTARSANLALAAVMSAGIVLRLWHWLYARSFWLDEARLALNVAGRSYAELTGPLWYDQSAPPLFLWASKLLATFTGVADISLRALPLIAGLLLPPLVFASASRLVSKRAALLAAAFAAISPWPVYYANEFKPYSSDAAVAAALLLLTLTVLKVPSRSRMGALAAAGALAPWFSVGTYFVLPCSWLAVAMKGTGRERQSMLWIGMLWGASLAAAYLLVYSNAATNAYLQQFWSDRMLTLGPAFGARLWSALEDLLVGTYLGFLQVPGAPDPSVVIATLLGAGLASSGALRILRRDRASGIALVGPLLLTIAAALAGRFPLALRVTMFIAPVLYIVLADSIDHYSVLFERRTGLRPFRALALLVLVVPALVSLQHAVRPERWGPVKAVVRDLARAAAPTDALYIGAGSLPVWAFYSMDWAHPDRRQLQALAVAASSNGYAFENRGEFPVSEDQLRPDPMSELHLKQIWGRATGMRWTPRGGFHPLNPDPRWAMGEARRIARVRASTVWVLTSHMFGAGTELREAIAVCGGRPLADLGRGNVGLTAHAFFLPGRVGDCN